MRYIAALCIFLSLVGCASKGGDFSSLSEDLTVIASSSEPVAQPVSNDFLALFDASSRVGLKLEMSNHAIHQIHKLQSDPNSIYNDFYFPGSLQVSLESGDIYCFDDVGVRMRGNTSRHGFVNSDGYIYEPVSFKVSLKETFDDPEYLTDENLIPFYHDWEGKSVERKNRKSRNLFGLEKLDLRKLPRGGTDMFLKETYCYNTMRSVGLLAPYANVVGFTLCTESDQWNGFYELSEPIDKDFLKRRFSKEDAKGDLYKCVHQSFGPANLKREGAIYTDGEQEGKRIPRGSIGVEDNYASYVPTYQLKTNDSGENSDFSAMENLLQIIHETASHNGDLDNLWEAIDITSFLRYNALSYLLGNIDDFRWNGNNYYLYFLPSTRKAIFIPYDFDYALGTVWDDSALSLAYSTPLARDKDKADYSPLLLTAFFPSVDENTGIVRELSTTSFHFLALVALYQNIVLNPKAYSGLCNTTGHHEDEKSVLDYFSKKKTAIRSWNISLTTTYL